MSSEFYFSLLRITTAQIFRAAGVDRCSPSVLDTATDITMRHLLLLADTCVDLAAGSGRSQVSIVDLAEAMVSIGLIRPCRAIDTSSADIEEGDEEGDGDDAAVTEHGSNNIIPPLIMGQDVAGFVQFIEWAKGPIPNDARVISRVVVPQAPSLAANPTAATTTPGVPTMSAGPTQPQQDVSALATTPAATENTSDQPSHHTGTPAPFTAATATTSQTAVVTEEWLTSLMKKQVKVGHEKRFHGTLLAEEDTSIPFTAPSAAGVPVSAASADSTTTTSEFKIMGGPTSLEEAFQHIIASSSSSPSLPVSFSS